MRFSKSRYAAGMRCPKIPWMDKHMPEKLDGSAHNGSLLEAGRAVRELARRRFGDCPEIPFDLHDFEGMSVRTRELLDEGAQVICGATFISEDCFCLVDVLRADGDGVRITGVNASNSLKTRILDGMAYQLHVVERCGLKVTGADALHLNPGYRREGGVDLGGLFVMEDVSCEVRRRAGAVPANLRRIAEAADSAAEPDMRVGRQCARPWACGYQAWCKRAFPSPSVFDLNGLGMGAAASLAYGRGIVTFEDVAGSGIALSPRQAAQVVCEVEGADEVVDRDAVRAFLGKLRFPLCFLDFETLCEAIPRFDGCGPWQQIPYQYSLHVLDGPECELRHLEFLAPEGEDPRRAVAERLCADIPHGACTLAYYADFERERLRELAEAFPDLASRLLAIEAGVVDLYEPFKLGAYYSRAMGGSNSLKAVLPALFPSNPELDYHALDGVHNGGEAMTAYAGLANRAPDERAAIREQLLRYCELDTLAMVRILGRLLETAEPCHLSSDIKWHGCKLPADMEPYAIPCYETIP